jgi:hypothetical protein
MRNCYGRREKKEKRCIKAKKCLLILEEFVVGEESKMGRLCFERQ